MPTIRILREAAEEAAEAMVWYERQRPGLGREFERALDAALDLLESDVIPLVSVPGESGKRGARRLVLRRFPFDIIVREHGQEFVVVAFAHHSRAPGYWHARQGA